MIDFGRLRHLSPPQIKVLQAANRGLVRSSKGRYVMAVDRASGWPGTPLNFAEALLPQLSVKTSTDPLQPRLLGCRIMGQQSLWYSNLTKRIETTPTYLRGGFARSLRKIESVLKGHKDDCAVMTTKERLERAGQSFKTVCLHTDTVPLTVRHLIVDEAHLLTTRRARKIGAAALPEQFRWIVSPHTKKAAQKALLALGLGQNGTDAPSFGSMCGTMLTEPRSLLEGECPICLEPGQRLLTVCENGHMCCTTCSPHLKRRCMLCRQKTKAYV